MQILIRQKTRIAAKVLVLVIILLLLILFRQYLRNIFIYPPLIGFQTVGYSSYEYISQDRLEKYLIYEEPRKLLIQIYYPIYPTLCGGKDIHDFTYQLEKVLANQMGEENALQLLDSPNTFKLIRNINRLPVCVDARIKSGKHPLLIYHHGLQMGPSLNDSLLVKLAAKGFFVISIGHTYDGFFTFPDDTTSGSVPEEERSGYLPFSDYAATYPLKLSIFTGDQPVYLKSSLYRELLRADTNYSGRVNYWMEDTYDVLENDIKRKFSEYINFEKINFIGHSLGGAVAGALCATEENCKSAVDIDGRPYGDWITVIDSDKFVYISRDDNDQELVLIKYLVGPDLNMVVIPNSSHYVLTDIVRPSSMIFDHFYIIGSAGGIQSNNYHLNPINRMEKVAIEFVLSRNR